MYSFASKVIAAASLLALNVRADHYQLNGQEDVRLRFNSDNHFKIMQVTDIHLGE